MRSPSHVTSSPVTPERARELVLALERRGLDTSRIHVDTTPPTTMRGTSRADRRSVARPGRRVAIGLLAGLTVGLVVGLVAAALFGSSDDSDALFDAASGSIILATSIGGAVVGGLVGLYARLPMSVEISDADSSPSSAIRVDVSGLSDDLIAEVTEQLESAEPKKPEGPNG